MTHEEQARLDEMNEQILRAKGDVVGFFVYISFIFAIGVTFVILLLW